ncbi:unnamed protein product [Phytophthora fragariaefolia]|uniref:Unnamed protein product n=1 Tax=Phytophthora fragariaefolia TaxID=1490495 RepID=A0A9W6WSZ9_9STRA|nr:unnamed protein product [Phytophthora fragariaefolia]
MGGDTAEAAPTEQQLITSQVRRRVVRRVRSSSLVLSSLASSLAVRAGPLDTRELQVLRRQRGLQLRQAAGAALDRERTASRESGRAYNMNRQTTLKLIDHDAAALVLECSDAVVDSGGVALLTGMCTASFRRKKVCNIISECMAKELEGKEFDESDSKSWTTSIADAVKARIHAECYFPRYKIVVQTFIGQQRLQDVRITSRCLWDNDHDNHASAVFNSVRLD